MSEFRVILLAVGVWVGATIALPVPPMPFVLAGGLALALRNELMLLAACCGLAMALGHRSELAYQSVAASSYEGDIQLLTDIERRSFGSVFESRLSDGRRVTVLANAELAAVVSGATVGSTLVVSGRLRPLADRPWHRSRHLVGSLTLSSADFVAGPPWWMQPSEFLRRLVSDGAEAFEPESSALYTGLVIGDDRHQSLAQRARFRRAGLTHLLAVSGQNVAFALVLLWPLARRFGLFGRALVIGLALVVFAMATRLEPSVLRATVTAGIAVVGMLLGRSPSGVRLLSLAVAGLILVDPFLVDSVGFRLSVAATAGILLFGPLLVERLPGPRPLVGAFAITVSAQIFVVPLLVSTFGPVSLVALPANLLAGWVAGLVMVWGLSIGLVAGQIPGGEWLQVPMVWALRWLDSVATWAANVPVPQLGSRGFVFLLAGLAGAWLWRGRSVTRMSVLAAIALVIGATAVANQPDNSLELSGARLYPSTSQTLSVLVVEADAGSMLVDELVANRVRADVVVFEQAGRSARVVAAAVIEVTAPGLVLAPPHHSLVGARRVTTAMELGIDGAVLVLRPDQSTMQARVDDG